jgi:ketosteroid isomerase-like protein
MRYIVTMLLLFVSASLFAQADANLQKTCTAFNKALLNRDTVTIKKLVDSKIQYGHSNGWIQTRQDIMNDMYNGKLTYTDIQQSDMQVRMEGNIALVRSNVAIDAAMNSKVVQFKLAVLQVWKKEKTGWILIARQAGKL